jgi:hypothetical protein
MIGEQNVTKLIIAKKVAAKEPSVLTVTDMPEPLYTAINNGIITLPTAKTILKNIDEYLEYPTGLYSLIGPLAIPLLLAYIPKRFRPDVERWKTWKEFMSDYSNWRMRYGQGKGYMISHSAKMLSSEIQKREKRAKVPKEMYDRPPQGQMVRGRESYVPPPPPPQEYQPPVQENVQYPMPSYQGEMSEEMRYGPMTVQQPYSAPPSLSQYEYGP